MATEAGNGARKCFLAGKMLYATPAEKCLTCVGVMLAGMTGVCIPLILLLLTDLAVICMHSQFQYESRHPRSFLTNKLQNQTDLVIVRIGSTMPYNNQSLYAVANTFAADTAILAGVIFLFTISYSIILSYVTTNQVRRIRVKYLEAAVMKTPSSKRPYMEIYRDMQRNIHNISAVLAADLGSLFQTLMIFTTSLAIAFNFHLGLAAILFVVLYPALMFIFFISLLAVGRCREIETSHFRIAENHARDVLQQLELVKSHRREVAETRRFDALLTTSVSATVWTIFLSGSSAGVLYFLMYMSYAATFMMGLTMTLDPEDKTTTPAKLIVVTVCMQLGFVCLIKMATHYVAWRKANSTLRKISATLTVLEEEAMLHECAGKRIGEINFSGVYFSCQDDSSACPSYLLSDVNFNITSCSLTALVGKPKSGKTSLVKLMVKLERAVRGCVQLGGCDVSGLNGSWVRSRVGVVQQKTTLLGGTVKEVLRGDSLLCDEEMVAACRTVNIHDYISKLPQAYNTNLTQIRCEEVLERLAIAQVLLKKPDIIILDDCLEASHVWAQVTIITDLMALRTMTVVVVTNNIEILRIADQIIHLTAEGVETGTYNTLRRSGSSLCTVLENSIGGVIPGFQTGVAQVSNMPKMRSPHYVGLDTESIATRGVIVDAFTYTRDAKHTTRRELPSRLDLTWCSVLALSSLETPYLCVASLAALVPAFSLPVYASLFGEALSSMVLDSREEIQQHTLVYPHMFLLAGLIVAAARITEAYMIALASSQFLRRLRRNVFITILQQTQDFFDWPENDVNSVLYLIRVHARKTVFLAGPQLMVVVKVSGVLVAASLLTSWQLESWLMLVLVAPCVASLIIGLLYLSKHRSSELGGENKTTTTMCRDILKHRETLATQNLVDIAISRFGSHLYSPHSSPIAQLLLRSLYFACAQAILYAVYAACMWYAARLLQDHDINFTIFMNVVASLFLGTALLGEAVMTVPDRYPCLQSASEVLRAISSVRNCPRTAMSKDTNRGTPDGSVEVQHVFFCHPSNQRVPRVYDVNIHVDSRQPVVGLVGLAHSGHSLLPQLLLGLYPPSAGRIVVDGVEVVAGTWTWPSSSVGLIDGVPSFLRRSVARNITFSAVDSSGLGLEPFVGMDDVMAAAILAGIHDFVCSLAEGYHTVLTPSLVARMTPGQVLRLSLARALLRKPRLLLLHNVGLEVQPAEQSLTNAAIRRACMGRFAVIYSDYAQAISTISNCIYVFHNGCVAELGSHEELMGKKGVYYEMYEEEGRQLAAARM